MRKCFVRTHRYAGLSMASFLTTAVLTESVLSFYNEINAWLNPQQYYVAVPDRPMRDPFTKRRGRFDHTLLVVVLIAQVLVPPVWIKYGLDCVRRCHFAATAGAHCPLMNDAHQNKTPHHCHAQGTALSPAGWHCHCSHSSPSLLNIPHFVLPQMVRVVRTTVAFCHTSEPGLLYSDRYLTPPDPPPRPSVGLLL